jgi:ankyrin repeat protein
MAALANLDLARAELLLRHGADPTCVTRSGDTALLAASRSGSEECVRLVLARGVDLMPAGIRENPLKCAASSDDGLGLIRMLLAAGVDPNRAGTDGELPLVSATLCKAPGAVALLRAAGADPDLPDGKGRTARSAAAGYPALAAALRAEG